MDFTVSDEGSIFLITPLTQDAADWFADNLDSDCMMFGNAYAVEHRYVGAILYGAQEDGLTSNVRVECNA
jgi:hypothetical protein